MLLVTLTLDPFILGFLKGNTQCNKRHSIEIAINIFVRGGLTGPRVEILLTILFFRSAEVYVGSNEFKGQHIEGVEPDVEIVIEFLFKAGVSNPDIQSIGSIRHILQLRNIGLVRSSVITRSADSSSGWASS